VRHRSTCLHRHACCPSRPGCNVSQSVAHPHRNACRSTLRPLSLSKELNASTHPCSMQAHTVQCGRLPPTLQQTAAHTIGMLPHSALSPKLRAKATHGMHALSLRQASSGINLRTHRRGQLAVLSGEYRPRMYRPALRCCSGVRLSFYGVDTFRMTLGGKACSNTCRLANAHLACTSMHVRNTQPVLYAHDVAGRAAASEPCCGRCAALRSGKSWDRPEDDSHSHSPARPQELQKGSGSSSGSGAGHSDKEQGGGQLQLLVLTCPTSNTCGAVNATRHVAGDSIAMLFLPDHSIAEADEQQKYTGVDVCCFPVTDQRDCPHWLWRGKQDTIQGEPNPVLQTAIVNIWTACTVLPYDQSAAWSTRFSPYITQSSASPPSSEPMSLL
jgi:hypothetical protein